jgi:hypothetical protein
VVPLDDKFHGIAQRSKFLDPEPGPTNEPHLQQALANLAFRLNHHNLSLISRVEMAERDW